VLFKHVLRNALIPVLTNVSVQLPGIFVGSFLIETFFSIPGLGREVPARCQSQRLSGDPGGNVYLAVLTMRDQPGGRCYVSRSGSSSGAEMSAATIAGKAVVPARPERSAGVWATALRRLRNDRVGMVSLAIVIAFVLLIVASALRLVAKDWQKEIGVPNAPPTLVGPRVEGSDQGPACKPGCQGRKTG